MCFLSKLPLVRVPTPQPLSQALFCFSPFPSKMKKENKKKALEILCPSSPQVRLLLQPLGRTT